MKILIACLWVASLLILQAPNDKGAIKQNGAGIANPSSNTAHAKTDTGDARPSGTVINCNQEIEADAHEGHADHSDEDVKIQRKIAKFTEYLVVVGAIQAFALIGTLLLIWRQATLMGTHADHFSKLAKATETQVILMEAQFDQWVVLANWKIWRQASDGPLRVSVDLVNLSQFPITLNEGILIFEKWGTTQATKYRLGQNTFISPTIPHVIEIDPNISAEQSDGTVAFSVSGHFLHSHRISKQPVIQPFSGILECSRWSIDRQWHATFTPHIHMNPEPAEKTDKAN